MKSAVLSRADSICISWIFYSFHASTCFIAALCLLSLYRILTFLALFVALLFVNVTFNFPSVSLFACLLIFLDLFVSRPVGRFMTGVALVKPSSGIKSQRVRQALSHYAGPPLLGFD